MAFAKSDEKRTAILKEALKLFNRNGIEYVGVREIAASIGMRPSHITYYFPTKEDIVVAIAQQLGELNDRNLSDPAEVDSLETFIDRFRQVMKNHIKFRCLPLSMPHLVERSPKMRDHLKRTQGRRKDDLRVMIQNLAGNHVVRQLQEEEIAYLIGCFSLISRGWLSETVAAGSRPETRIDHYLDLIRMHLRPFLRDQGGKRSVKK